MHYSDRTLRQRCWTLSGRHFGYWEGNDLWSYHGHHVGRLRGADIFAPDGRYIGEMMGNGRLAVRSRKIGTYGTAFIPWPPRFPGPAEFRPQIPTAAFPASIPC